MLCILPISLPFWFLPHWFIQLHVLPYSLRTESDVWHKSDLSTGDMMNCISFVIWWLVFYSDKTFTIDWVLSINNQSLNQNSLTFFFAYMKISLCNDQLWWWWWSTWGWPAHMWQKLLDCDFLRHHKYDKCQTLHDDSIYWGLPIHTTFSGLDCIWRPQQCQTILTENFMFLSD